MSSREWQAALDGRGFRFVSHSLDLDLPTRRKDVEKQISTAALKWNQTLELREDLHKVAIFNIARSVSQNVPQQGTDEYKKFLEA